MVGGVTLLFGERNLRVFRGERNRIAFKGTLFGCSDNLKHLLGDNFFDWFGLCYEG